MAINLNHLDRRRFLRGSGIALSLPLLLSGLPLSAAVSEKQKNPKAAGVYLLSRRRPDAAAGRSGAQGLVVVPPRRRSGF